MSLNVKANGGKHTLAESSEVLKCHMQTASWTTNPGTRNINDWSMTLPESGEVVAIMMEVAGGYSSTVSPGIRTWTQSGTKVTPAIVIESTRSSNQDVNFRLIVLYK